MFFLSIEGLDRPFIALMLTNGYEVGEPHWQLRDDARLLCGIQTPEGHVAYLQPTGSLDLQTTCELTKQATTVVTNMDELGKLAISSNILWTVTDETAPEASQIAKQTLFALWDRGTLRGPCVTTLGRNGCVTVDFHSQAAWHFRMKLRNGHSCVPTRNGTGDRWTAEYMYCCVVEHKECVAASQTAVARVAVWLGLNPSAFVVQKKKL